MGTAKRDPSACFAPESAAIFARSCTKSNRSEHVPLGIQLLLDPIPGRQPLDLQDVASCAAVAGLLSTFVRWATDLSASAIASGATLPDDIQMLFAKRIDAGLLLKAATACDPFAACDESTGDLEQQLDETGRRAHNPFMALTPADLIAPPPDASGAEQRTLSPGNAADLPRVIYCPMYGCSLILTHAIANRASTTTTFTLIGLDDWAFRVHGISGSERVHVTLCDAHAPVHLGDCPSRLEAKVVDKLKTELEKAKGRTGDQRRAQNTEGTRGHQRTPAFVASIIADALASVSGSASASASSARGGFTDVGLHTGGRRRCTARPLVEATFLEVLRLLCRGSDPCAERPTAPDKLAPRVLALLHSRLLTDNLAVADAALSPAALETDAAYFGSPDFLNVAARFLEVAASQGARIVADKDRDRTTESVTAFTVALEGLRRQLDDIRDRAASRMSHCHTLCGSNLALSYVEPTVSIPPALQLRHSRRVDVMTEAEAHLRHLPVKKSFSSPLELLTWMKQMSAVSEPNGIAHQLLLSSAEDFLYHLAESDLRTVVATAEPDEEVNADVLTNALTQIGKLYDSSYAAAVTTRFEPEKRSRRVLFHWTLFCLVHQWCLRAYPTLREFDVPLDFALLQALVLGSRSARSTLRIIACYLKQHKRLRKPLFSTEMQVQGQSEQFAEVFIARDQSADAKQLRLHLKAERNAIEERVKQRWQQIQKKKKTLQDLRGQLSTAKSKLRKAEQARDRQKRLDTNNSVHGCPHYNQSSGFYWRRHHECEHTTTFQQLQSTFQNLSSTVDSLESMIVAENKPPPVIYCALSRDDRRGRQEFYFLHMPEAHSRLAEAGRYALEVMLEGGAATPASARSDKQQSLRGWLKDYSQNRNVYGTEPKDSSLTIVHSDKEKKPERHGSSAVDNIFREDDGVWWPDVFGHVLQWRDGAMAAFRIASRINPLGQRPDFVLKSPTYTTQLAPPYRRLQWIVDAPEVGDGRHQSERPNVPLAQLDSKPSTLRKDRFLALANLRSHPKTQLRKLWAAFESDSLHLDGELEQAAVRQLLWQVGELSCQDSAAVVGDLPRAVLLWHDFTWQHPNFMGSMALVLNRFAERILNAPKSFRQVRLLGELLGYFSEFPGPHQQEFFNTRSRLAGGVEKWAFDLDAAVEESQRGDNSRTHELHTKQATFLLLALLCYAAGPLDQAAARAMMRLRVRAHSRLPTHQGLTGARDSEDVKLCLELDSLAAEAMARRSRELLFHLEANVACLGTIVHQVISGADQSQEWFAAGAYHQADPTVSSLAFHAWDQGNNNLYSVHILTGAVLYNGAPPGRLPQPLVCHPGYRVLFGVRNFDVVTCRADEYVAVPCYRTARQIQGREYRFFLDPQAGADKATQLRVFELEGGSAMATQRVYEYLADPPSFWGSGVPTILQEEYSHWYCRKEGSFALRPPTYLDRSISFFATTKRRSLDGVVDATDAFVYEVPEHRRACGWDTLAAEAADKFRQLLVPGPVAQLPAVGAPLPPHAVLGKFEDPAFIHIFRPPRQPGHASSPSASVDSASSASHASASPATLLQFVFARYANLELVLRLPDRRFYSTAHNGMVLREVQQLPDTLYGFTNYLLLDALGEDSLPDRPRTHMLVPDRQVQKDGTLDIGSTAGPTPRLLHKLSFHSFGIHPRFGYLQASSVESRLQLASIYAAADSALPERRLDMTAGEFACELVRWSWVNRPLSLAERGHLDLVWQSSGLVPTLALLCEDLVASSEQLAFLFVGADQGEASVAPQASAGEGRDEEGQVTFSVLANADAHTEYALRWHDGVLSWRTELSEEEARRLPGNLPFGEVRPEAPRELKLPKCKVTRTFLEKVEKGLANQVTEHQSPDGSDSFPLRGKGEGRFEARLRSELEMSWKEEMKQVALTIADPPSLQSILCDCSTRIQGPLNQLWLHVCEAIDTGVRDGTDRYALQQRLRAVCNRRPLLRRADLVRVVVTEKEEHPLLLQMNPLLADVKGHNARAVREAILLWMQYCVMQDRLLRLRCMLRPGAGTDVAAEKLAKELQMSREWQPRQHPHWLAFEVVGGIQIRPVQYQVAKSLMENPGAVEQLNMGEGKTRVILPMLVLHVLAVQREAAQPGHRRGRVTPRLHFLPELLEEAHDFLHRCLCATELNVRFVRMPFHRDVDITGEQPDVLVHVLRDAALSRCSIIVSPEHRLSMQLRCVEVRLQQADDCSPGAEPTSGSLARVADKLDMVEAGEVEFWNIMDESDALLRHRYQVVYATGKRVALPQQESRCNAAMALLRIAAQSEDLDVFWDSQQRSGGCVFDRQTDPRRMGVYPWITISFGGADSGPNSGPNRGATLCRYLADALYDNPPEELKWIELWARPANIELGDGPPLLPRKVFRNCLVLATKSVEDILEKHPELARKLQEKGKMDDLLALRGLLAHGTLLHALSLRHNVDYGIDRRQLLPDRTQMAVPYRASQTPAERSEFQHPDLSIALTLLSYFHDGLSDAELVEAVALLLDLNPAHQKTTYARWIAVSRGELSPELYKSIDAAEKIDLSNQHMVQLLTNVFARNFETVSFWLHHVVFKRDTRQFEARIFKTSWDLCNSFRLGPRASLSRNRAVGFSGTNDTKELLPAHVHQRTPSVSELLATNGKMMAILLQIKTCKEVSSLEELVQTAVARNCQALIDAGALAASRKNQEVATMILRLLERQAGAEDERQQRYSGVVYFAEDNKWHVLTADKDWMLAVAPVSTRQCFVYYDQARTRGADHKLPANAKGMLTVGKGQAKDQLMQAAGRLRQLSRTGPGQQLELAVPRDVAATIRATQNCHDLDPLSVLKFVLGNTTSVLKLGLPAMVAQGIHHYRTRSATRVRRELIKEALAVDEMYADCSRRLPFPEVCRERYGRLLELASGAPKNAQQQDATRESLLATVQAKVATFGLDAQVLVGTHVARAQGSVNEECERELQREQEQEQEEELQVRGLLPWPELDNDIASILDGQSLRGLPHAKTVTKYLTSRFANDSDSGVPRIAWPAQMFVTGNFDRTVRGGGEDRTDCDHLRLVGAVLLFPSRVVLLLSEGEHDTVLDLPQVRAHTRGGAVLASKEALVALVNGAYGSASVGLLLACGPEGIVPLAQPPPWLRDWDLGPTVTALELLAGETCFPDARHNLVRRLLPTERARARALQLPRARGLAFLLEGSDLHCLCTQEA